jgi:hypothetical protein|nr:MAG TPA: hypothetical protein [Caudoviricetes sp.]
MSNENSNLRVGSAGAGLFVGSTEILGGVSNIIDNNYTAPCKIVVINASDKVFDGFFSADSGMVPILLQPNEVIYKAFDANISVFLDLSDTSKSIDGSLSYGYDDGTPIVDNYSFNGQIEIQFSGDSEVKATYICIITQING